MCGPRGNVAALEALELPGKEGVARSIVCHERSISAGRLGHCSCSYDFAVAHRDPRSRSLDLATPRSDEAQGARELTMISAARSATAYTAAWMCAVTEIGMILASTTRRPLTPLTVQSVLTTEPIAAVPAKW